MTSKLASMFYPGDDGTGKEDSSKPENVTQEQTSQQDDSITAAPKAASPAVRFASGVQEIEPAHSIKEMTPSAAEDINNGENLSPEAKEEIRNLAVSLQGSKLQESRLSNFNYEPMSLPTSRATSRDPSPRASPRPSVTPSGKPSPAVSSLNSPPLTPRNSRSREPSTDAVPRVKQEVKSNSITPQTSLPQQGQAQGTTRTMSESISPSATPSQAPSSELPSTRQTSVSEESIPEAPKRSPRFTVGPSGTSSPGERSPVHTPKSQSPNRQRPPTPSGEQSKARMQSKAVFGKDPKRSSLTPAEALQNAHLLPRTGPKANEAKHDKRASIFSGKKDGLSHVHDESSGQTSEKKHHGSMSELKRFFRIGNKHKRSESPGPSSRKSSSRSTAVLPAPPHQAPPSNVPFADEHGLEARYGKFGKVLGSGAGGSVRLLKRSSDGVTFAVKQFREKHNWESEKDYAKKVTAEFCIGSTLHHGNIIETMDIIQENDRWFEVMEYAPFDLFATVMTGKMSREEVSCCFLQIVHGVDYLHTMGLAHRDLKLDNVVVNEHGIMKLIDFGSATVFRYPFENDLVLASGIVGSDPYLAPEVYDEKKYDPTATDVWSLAIIFCCMSLRRFPWKQPRVIDNSYKLFVAPPTPGTPIPDSVPRHTSENRSRGQLAPGDDHDPRRSSEPSPSREANGHEKTSHHHTSRHHSEGGSKAAETSDQAGKAEVIKGPWRLLRILPRETRHIIGRMLKVDPKERATLEEILDDDWIQSISVCSQDEQCEVHSAQGHKHTLEPGSAPQPAEKEKK